MKREDQFCTKKQMRELHKLGVSESDTTLYAPISEKLFNVAELGVMLPCRIWIGNNMYNLTFQKYDEHWHKDKYQDWRQKGKNEFWYQYDFINKDGEMEILGDKQTETSCEAVSRAEMLIFLLMNKYIKAKEVNERLKNS